jgi:copper chaperone
MNTLQFKTNIKCTGCLSKVAPILNEKLGEGKWEVDLMTLKKTLTVTTPDVEQAEVIEIVKETGFTAEAI